MKRATAILACLAILALSACSKSTTPEPAPPASEEAPVTEESSAPVADGPVTIVTTEYAFAIPTIAPGEHEIVLQNDGEQVHMAAIVQLLDGKTVEDAMAYIEENGTEGEAPSWAKEVGFGIAPPGVTSPVGAGEGEPQPGDTLEFEAGDYVALCFIPDGMTSMDQKPPKGAKSHAELGMVQGFTVA